MEVAVASVFKDAMQDPTPTAGKIALAGRNMVVTSTWAQRNVERGNVMLSKFIQLFDLDRVEVTNLNATENSTDLMTSQSPCSKYQFVLRDVPPSGKQPKTTHLELWSGNKMIKNLDVSSVDVHGDMYTDGDFGCLEWSPRCNKILYSAEKKKKKSAPFLPLPSKRMDNVTYGAEYVMAEDWGETMVGKSSPVLAVWDTEKNEVSVVTPGSSELSFGQGVWAPDGSIVCVGWETQPRRLGKYGLTNRTNWLLHVTNGTATKLTNDGVSITSPKFAKDGSKLVWLERDVGGTHGTSLKLMKMDWPTKQISVVVDAVDYSVTAEGGVPFFGIYGTYLTNFSVSLGNCWLSDNRTVIVSSTQRASFRMYAIDTETREIWDISGCSSDDEEFSIGVLDVHGNYILACKSSLLLTPSLLVGEFNYKKRAVDWLSLPLVESSPTVPNYQVDILRLESNVKTEVTKDFTALYFGPKTGCQVPLIVFPHGGPHDTSCNCYNPLATFFGKLGFAVLFVNFRGSTGVGDASLKSLFGNIGTTDVSDCHQSATHVLNKYSDVLSPEKCLLFGISHGGFLVLHLSGQYPTFFKSAVAANPVSDIATFQSSDIPDWAWVESGLTYTHTAEIDADVFQAMKKMSPISHVDSVTAPTLLLIGKNDLRVPPSQGVNHYYALKARGVKTKCLMYEDIHVLPKTPSVVDWAINTVLWFLDSIQHELPATENIR